MISELWAATKVGLATGITMFAAAPIIDQGRVSVTVAVSCTVFVCGCCWWLSSRFTRIDDRLEKIEHDLKSRPCQLNGECKTNKKP